MKKFFDNFVMVFLGILATVWAVFQIVLSAVIPALILYILFMVACQLSEKM